MYVILKELHIKIDTLIKYKRLKYLERAFYNLKYLNLFSKIQNSSGDNYV